MIKIIDNPLVKHFLTILRNKDSKTSEFRNAASKLSSCLAMEAASSLSVESFIIETPIEATSGYKIKENIILLPILRAGLGMLQPFLDIYSDAVIGYHGLKRDELLHTPAEYYYSFPQVKENDRIFILDPMIATGNSICATIGALQFAGASNVVICSLISAPQGIEKILSEFPETEIYTCSLDKGLNENAYIVPGLGDAGDRLNGF